jgi:RimJ/RimL family protein N-acetyltransferase
MVSVRTLTPLELPRYRDHLLRLGIHDRRLRFGFSIPDERIIDFVDRISALDTRIMVHSAPDLAVVGAVQVSTTSWQAVEFAFSVEAPYRGRGVATALFERALLWARNRSIQRAYVQCLAENHAMRRIARKAQMAILTETGESEGILNIPAGTPVTLFNEMMAENAGLCDAFAKTNRRAFTRLLPTALAFE